MSIVTDVVVLGSGPGGYSAAFRLADLGKKVILIERYKNLGGVCLNVGCIPSKALLHTAQIINEAREAINIGIDCGKIKLDIDKIRANKNNIVTKLTKGITALANARKVKIINTYAKFLSKNEIITENGEVIEFKHCIIAVGSRVNKPDIFPFIDNKIMDSTDALELKDIPQKLLIVGGGIIGLEMATVYHALGSEITIVEHSSQLISAADKDIVAPLYRKINKLYNNIYLNTKVNEITVKNNKVLVKLIGKEKFSEEFDKAIIAVGRQPNSDVIDIDKAGIAVNKNGFIVVDKQMRTNISNIFAIGDVVGQPMLAHKAVHEGKIAAEVICNKKVEFMALAIPSVAYTDPEIAWSGKTEQELLAQNITYEKGVFPWAASGRSLSIGRNDGLSKALFDKKTKRLIGMGICGTNAGELIAEATLAIEMGADMTDISLSIHAHPTLSETTAFAAEMAEGTITDLLPSKKQYNKSI